MSEEIIVQTHNDLDAIGSMLNIEQNFPGVQKKFFFTNYSNIPEQVDQILAYAEVHGNKHIIIPDVSFSDNKESLTRLYAHFSAIGSITHIDHHLYPDGFWDCYPNMTVVWDKSKCATLLCYEYFNNQHEALHRLSKVIDVYDIWQVDHPAFDVAQDINEYFWAKGGVNDGNLFQEIVDNDYSIPNDFSTKIAEIKADYNNAINEYETKGFIKRSSGITFAFVNEWFNQILLKEMAAGQAFVIGITTYGIVRVRINEKSDISEGSKHKLRDTLTGAITGHLNAFTYKTEFKGFDEMVSEAERIANAIDDMGNL